ncbi:MAG: hypothetical protein ACLGIM_16290, partial [Alphaproteobacteria bacterium]
YLAEDPSIAISVLLQHYVENGEQDPRRPSEVLNEMCVIVLDDSRVERSKLLPDPEFDAAWKVWVYPTQIDATNMPVLSIDQITDDWHRRGLIKA